MTNKITQDMYEAAYRRAHEMREETFAKTWNWLFSRKAG